MCGDTKLARLFTALQIYGFTKRRVRSGAVFQQHQRPFPSLTRDILNGMNTEDNPGLTAQADMMTNRSEAKTIMINEKLYLIGNDVRNLKGEHYLRIETVYAASEEEALKDCPNAIWITPFSETIPSGMMPTRVEWGKPFLTGEKILIEKEE